MALTLRQHRQPGRDAYPRCVGSGPEYEPPPPFAPPPARTQPLAGPPPAVGFGAEFGTGVGAAPPDAGPPRPSWQVVVLAAAAIAAMALVAIVGLFRAGHLAAQPRRPHTLTLPDRAGSYVLLRSIDPAMVRNMLGSQVGSLGPVQDALASAQIGVYGDSPTAAPTVIFVGFAGADSTTIADLLSANGASTAVDQVLTGTTGGSPGTSVDPGPMGGALKCANAERNGTAFTPCAWADADTLAVVMRVGTVSLNDAADITRTLRAAAEH